VLKLPEVEGIEEVVNGEIQKMPPNKWNHARTVEQLAQLLRAQVDSEKTDVVTAAATDFEARWWNKMATSTPPPS
jgi:hypothetical protein